MRNFGTDRGAVYLPDWKDFQTRVWHTSQGLGIDPEFVTVNNGTDMAVDTFCFTYFWLDDPVELNALSVDLKLGATAMTSSDEVQVRATVYESFPHHNFGWMPWRPAQRPDGSHLVFHLDQPWPQAASATARLMIPPEDVFADPIILPGGRPYWVCSNWGTNFVAGAQLRSRTIPEFSDANAFRPDFARANADGMVWSSSLEFPEYTQFELDAVANGVANSTNISFSSGNAAKMLTARIDFGLHLRRIHS